MCSCAHVGICARVRPWLLRELAGVHRAVGQVGLRVLEILMDPRSGFRAFTTRAGHDKVWR